MKTISASELKTRCAPLIREVYSTREPVLITKRGKPVARLVPAGKPVKFIGSLKGIFKIVGDIESPVKAPEAWETAPPDVERVLRRYRRERAQATASDLRLINRAAKRLKSEAADILEYQPERTAQKRGREPGLSLPKGRPRHTN